MRHVLLTEYSVAAVHSVVAGHPDLDRPLKESDAVVTTRAVELREEARPPTGPVIMAWFVL